MLEIKNVSVRLGNSSLIDDINLVLGPAATLAIIGPSGSGKSTLAKAIAGELFHSGSITFDHKSVIGQVAYVPQEHAFKNLSNTNDFYYQQRFNASEAELSLLVSELLGDKDDWIDVLQLRPLLARPIIQLSNGENKRLQLAQKLQLRPSLLVLDNPFLGLDFGGRNVLENILKTLSEQGVQIILVTSARSLPSFITHVAFLDKGRLVFFDAIDRFIESRFSQPDNLKHIHPDVLRPLLPKSLAAFEYAFSMTDVHVQYGSQTILNRLDWKVKRGECWSLSGPNGAGKSTLLSLINGDNPQAYANEIYLFDRKRGTGESIWDIKKQIGYVSPELHLFFDQTASCWEIIASGFFDTIGLFRVLDEDQKKIIDAWLKILDLGSCANKSLRSMSRGEQRLALLGRALVKSPPMLILDEPCQGLDSRQTEFFNALIDFVCRESGTTLIYVSHYTEDMPGCITQYLRLDGGKVLPA